MRRLGSAIDEALASLQRRSPRTLSGSGGDPPGEVDSSEDSGAGGVPVDCWVYVAAPKELVLDACEVAQAIQWLPGVGICSSWHRDYHPGDVDPEHPSLRLEILRRNVRDLRRARCVVLVTQGRYGRETFVELGRALERGLPVVWWMKGESEVPLSWSDPLVIRAASLPSVVRAVRCVRAEIREGMLS